MQRTSQPHASRVNGVELPHSAPHLLPHEGEVGGCGSHEEVDAVALLALEEVATEAEVAFEMADAGFGLKPSKLGWRARRTSSISDKAQEFSMRG